MKKSFLAAAVAAFTLSAVSLNASAFETSTLNSGLGKGNVVTLEAAPLQLSGKSIKVGGLFPSVLLKDASLANFDTSKSSDKVRIYTVIASVDTPVCDQQVKDLSAFVESNNLKGIEMYAVSADTAFAQARFKKAAKLSDKIIFLSDSINHDFGRNTGTEISALGLLTRTTIVVDKNNRIRHIQRVPELTTIPDLKEAVSVAKKYI